MLNTLQVDNSVKPDVIDIDSDTSDPSAVSEYAYEIFTNMKRREVCMKSNNKTSKHVKLECKMIQLSNEELSFLGNSNKLVCTVPLSPA